jgi:hypothetical protein
MSRMGSIKVAYHLGQRLEGDSWSPGLPQAPGPIVGSGGRVAGAVGSRGRLGGVQETLWPELRCMHCLGAIPGLGAAGDAEGPRWIAPQLARPAEVEEHTQQCLAPVAPVTKGTRG